jgi:hypothetical protein
MTYIMWGAPMSEWKRDEKIRENQKNQRRVFIKKG